MERFLFVLYSLIVLEELLQKLDNLENYVITDVHESEF